MEETGWNYWEDDECSGVAVYREQWRLFVGTDLGFSGT